MPSTGKTFQPKNGLLRWFDQQLPILSLIHDSVGAGYAAPKNLNYFWNFGSLAGLCLVVQLVTGIVLAMHYQPSTAAAFDSVEHIMRNVNYGWLLRYLHANGASMFFLVVFIHIFRGLYYGSYKPPREMLWILGVVILLLMMATAFMGYVLPWGQMSFWAATVITNLFSAVPVVGDAIVSLLWGGFSVDNPTLNRFYSLHYLLPFVIIGVVILHVWALHIPGSNNPLGIDVKGPQDTVPFHPYYTVKDAFGVAVFLLVLCFFVFYAPNYMGHPDNYIPADPLNTPAHIVPEWYFLPFYAILRSITFDVLFIEAKLGGVILMFGSILVLLALPWLDRSKVRSAKFRPLYRFFFWIFVLDCLVLGWVGANSPDLVVMDLGPDKIAIAERIEGELNDADKEALLATDTSDLAVLAQFGRKAGLSQEAFSQIASEQGLDTAAITKEIEKALRQANADAVAEVDVDNLAALEEFALAAGLSQEDFDTIVKEQRITIDAVHVGMLGTFWYFFHFLGLIPLLGRLERTRPLPESISSPVLPQAAPAE